MDFRIQTTSNMYNSNRGSCSTSNCRRFTTANVPDNKMYVPLTSSSSLVFSLPSVLCTIADPGYDAKKLYEYSKNTLGIDLICPIERYKSTSKKRLELVCFYGSEIGQAIYSRRRISIEPMIEHLKSVFRIDQLSVRGFQSVSAIVLLSILLYQIMVYYNCKTEKSNPKSIKYMLGTLRGHGDRIKMMNLEL